MPEINEIDWNALGMPQASKLLQDILADDPEVRQTAYYNFYDLGLYDIPPAAPQIVPFLIDDLRGPTPDPSALLNALGDLADNASAMDAIEPCADCAATLDAIGQGVDVYLSYLTSTPDAAKYATNVLSFLSAQAERIVLAYLDVFGQVAPETQANILISIFRLMMAPNADPVVRQMLDVDGLAVLFDQPGSGEMQYGAALLLAELMGPALPERVENWLVKDAIYKSNMQTGYIDPYRDALRALGVERASADFIRLIAAITKPYLIASTLDQLLDMVLGDQSSIPRVPEFVRQGKDVIGVNFESADTPYPLRSASSLSAFQRSVLGQLMNVEHVWSIEHNVFTLHGLPNNRAGLSAFLSA